MGLAKKPTSVTTGSQTTLESGTQAAIDRLKTAEQKTETKADKPTYKQRDFDKEARGKTRCTAYESALMSPAIAGMQWEGSAGLKKLVREMADDCVAYTFEDDKKE